jgi:hypothetical protein
MNYVISKKVLARMKLKREDQFHELMYVGVKFLLFLIFFLLSFIMYMLWANILKL